MANKNARKLKLNASFKALDILLPLEQNNRYDLIVDSSFLHCIVFDSDRNKCYDFVKKSLSEEGIFFIHTMIKSNDMSEMLSLKHIFLENEILWSTGNNEWGIDWKEVQGRKVFPTEELCALIESGVK